MYAKKSVDADLLIPLIPMIPQTESIAALHLLFQIGQLMEVGLFNGPILEDGSKLVIITHALITLFLVDQLDNK